MPSITYPFQPKSTAKLVPGQYWGVPLSNGTYACGRVVQVLAKGVEGSRVTFLAGLMDWNGSEPPNAATIAGADFLGQGQAHLKTITENGGTVLGHRPLETNNLNPWQFRGAEFFRNSYVYEGLIKARPQTPDDDKLPVLGVWGFKFITTLAEKEFVRREAAS